jgi:hypothetical protein
MIIATVTRIVLKSHVCRLCLLLLSINVVVASRRSPHSLKGIRLLFFRTPAK